MDQRQSPVLLPINQINDFFWELVTRKQSLLIHTIAQQSLMLELICREKQVGREEKENILWTGRYETAVAYLLY